MINFCLSFLAGTLLGWPLFVMTDLSPVLVALISLITIVFVYFILERIIISKGNKLVHKAQGEMAGNKDEIAIETLKTAKKKYGTWRFAFNKQMDSQIGILLYRMRKFDEALEYLSRGSARYWVAMAMLGIIYMKRNKTDQMIDTFEKAVTLNSKVPLLWNVYAYSLAETGPKEKAIEIINKALKKTGGDERLQANLLALVDGRKMNMQSYGDLWNLFQLENNKPVLRKRHKGFKRR